MLTKHCSKKWRSWTKRKWFRIIQIQVACENICFSSLFTTGDISHGGTSATQRQKFYTDDIKSVRNPVRSTDWSTEYSYIVLAFNCLRMTDKREKAPKVKFKHEESLANSQYLWNILFSSRSVWVFAGARW